MQARLSFENSGTGSASPVVITQEEFKEKMRNSILLLDSFTVMIPAWNFQSGLDYWTEIADVIKIARASGKTVLDYSIVSDNEGIQRNVMNGHVQF